MHSSSHHTTRLVSLSALGKGMITAILAIPLLGSTALAQTKTDLAIDGSSGKYFAEEPEACEAAKQDASSAATRECSRRGGEAGEPSLSDCTCEQGGFEDSEFLCSATATLACTVADDAEPASDPKPMSTATKLSFALPETLTNLELIEADFQRRGRTLPRASIGERYQQACENGWATACQAELWHEDGVLNIDNAVVPLEKACDTGDSAACIAYAWTRERAARKSGVDSEYKAAARIYKSLCDSQDVQYACYEYGAILFNNLGVTADPRLGVRRWKNACEAGGGAACTALARVYRSGAGKIEADAEKADTFAKMACDAGDPFGCVEAAKGSSDPMAVPEQQTILCQKGGVDACWKLASAYLSGERAEPAAGVTRGLLDLGCELGNGPSCAAAASAALEDGDDSVAAGLFRRACKSGDINSCVGLVDLVLAERVAGSVRQDKYAFEVACSRGEQASACSELGLALLEGETVKKDSARARALLKQSCVDKTSPARPCFVLGDMYETGSGGERDRTLAATYYKWACAQGWGEACDRRGDLLDNGVGVREDDAEAVATYQQGCESGLPRSCHKAGVILDEGTNIPRDAKRALQLYTQGCEKGVGDSCLRLGKLYVEGVAAEQDDNAAREAYEKAVALNNIEAHRRLARLLWNGLGGKKNKRRAKELCSIGCQNADAIACRGPSWQTPD